MPNDYLTTDTELTSVANAIRTKGGTSSSLVYPTGFVSAINAIPTGGGGTDVSDTTAVAGDVLSGKYFHIADGTKVQGTIASKTSSDVTTNNNVVTIPSGHYASQVQKTVGTAQAAQTITPTTTDQTIASGKYLTGTQTIKGDANLIAGNIKKNVSIFGVTGNYEGGGGGGSGIKHAVYEWASSSDSFVYISGDVLSESEVNDSYMTCIGSIGCLLMKTHDDSGYINYATLDGVLDATELEYVEYYQLYIHYASSFSDYMQDGDRLDVFVLPSN